MNKRNKGRMLEKMVAELFRQAGWCVHLVQPALGHNPKAKRFYSRPQDILGADIIAIRLNSPIIFVQVTCDSGIGRKVKKFQEYPFPPEITRRYLFQAKKSKKWKYRVMRISETGAEPIDVHELEELFGEWLWKNADLFLVGYSLG